MPTFSPDIEAETMVRRPYTRLTNQEIATHLDNHVYRNKPWMYFDSIDSVLNTRSDITLVVGDGRSTDSIREELKNHLNTPDGAYCLELYDNKMSQWLIYNDILGKYATPETKYFVFTSSDVIWLMDWVAEAVKEFERNPKLQILFPCVNRGDPNLPCQIAAGPRDMDLIDPPYQQAARAPVINAYAFIIRMDFLRTYGGYPTAFKNCFSESFLYYMCEAMGGEMRLMPRGWVFHWGEGDKWSPPGGSPYNYNEEKMKFEGVINKVLMYRAMGLMTVDFLKETLYK
jgi:hypothetical protein